MGNEELIDNFHIVFMCTGNQARSVIAEHYTRKITAGLPVTVESVGTMDIPASPALPEAIEVGKGLGLNLQEHSSRCYTAVDLTQMDLVIGFDQNHVATAVVDGGAAPDKTFKLLELTRLLETSGPQTGSAEAPVNARSHIADAADRRRQDAFVAGEDLADPAGKKVAFFEKTAASIKGACDTVVEHLFRSTSQTAEPEAPESSDSRGVRLWD